MANTLQALSDAMGTVVATVTPSIVSVSARRRLPATGLVYSEDGIIITSNHVVERDEQITVTTHEGASYDATLIGRDPQNDLAVLKADTQLTAATWGDNDTLKVGNLVLALGKPGEQVQATLGVVSALVSSSLQEKRRERRKKRGRKGRRRNWQMLVDGYIQTDVVMYPGFSGGALVSGDGTIHGVNTSGFGRGISVTVPVTTIRTTIATLQEHGKMKQGYLGLGLQPAHLPDTVAEAIEQDTGLLVVSVEADSPAANDGLLVGDILVSLDGESVEQIDELMALLTGNRIGQATSLQVVRGGQLTELSITVGEKA